MAIEGGSTKDRVIITNNCAIAVEEGMTEDGVTEDAANMDGTIKDRATKDDTNKDRVNKVVAIEECKR